MAKNGTKQCPGCGRMLDKKQEYCTNCGRKVADDVLQDDLGLM